MTGSINEFVHETASTLEMVVNRQIMYSKRPTPPHQKKKKPQHRNFNSCLKMDLYFCACALLFGATLINAQATPLTAQISRFAQVPAGLNLDTGLVLWLDASNSNNTVASPQGNVVNWQSSNNVNNQSLVFSAPSNSQAPQLNLAHSRFSGYPVFNLRFVRSFSQFYQFSPKPSQEFPTNFEKYVQYGSFTAINH